MNTAACVTLTVTPSQDDEEEEEEDMSPKYVLGKRVLVNSQIMEAG
jgi:hypothetical protein